jgi:steroid delta-isomerase-like uncharacterized protein
MTAAGSDACSASVQSFADALCSAVASTAARLALLGGTEEGVRPYMRIRRQEKAPLLLAGFAGRSARATYSGPWLRLDSAFPDCQFTVEDQIAEGPMVVTRWTVTGTHRGNLGNIPATGRRMSVTGISWSRVENGKFVESWTSWDTLGMLQQLGVAEAPAQRAA